MWHLDQKVYPGRVEMSGEEVGHADYFVTQFLMGHGCFKAYLR